MAVGKVSEGYDDAAGRAKETAERSVLAGCRIWRVTGMMAGRVDLLCGFQSEYGGILVLGELGSPYVLV